MRQAAREAGNFVEPGDKDIAAALELGAHFLHRALISAESFDPSDLSEACSTGVGVRHQPGHVHGQVGTHRPVAHAPSRHGIGLGEAIEHDGTLLPALHRHDGKMGSLEEQTAVDFVAEHHDVAVANRPGDGAHVTLGHHPAGGIMRRVQDDELSAVGDQRGEFIHIKIKVFFFAQANGYCMRAQKLDHGFVDRKSGVGKYNLIFFFN